MEDGISGQFEGRDVRFFHLIPSLIAAALSKALTGLFALGKLVPVLTQIILILGFSIKYCSEMIIDYNGLNWILLESKLWTASVH